MQKSHIVVVVVNNVRILLAERVAYDVKKATFDTKMLRNAMYYIDGLGL